MFKSRAIDYINQHNHKHNALLSPDTLVTPPPPPPPPPL